MLRLQGGIEPRRGSANLYRTGGEKKRVREYRCGQSEGETGKRKPDPDGSMGNTGPGKRSTPGRKVPFLPSVLEDICFSITLLRLVLAPFRVVNVAPAAAPQSAA